MLCLSHQHVSHDVLINIRFKHDEWGVLWTELCYVAVAATLTWCFSLKMVHSLKMNHPRTYVYVELFYYFVHGAYPCTGAIVSQVFCILWSKNVPVCRSEFVRVVYVHMPCWWTQEWHMQPCIAGFTRGWRTWKGTYTPGASGDLSTLSGAGEDFSTHPHL